MTLSLRGSKATAAISREGGFPQSIFFIALVVGYFANAQYDVKEKYVILNGSEESHDLSEEYMPSREVFLRYFAVHII